MIVYDLVAHFSITMFLGWIHIRPRIQSLKDCYHLVQNQRSVCNEQFGEWYDSFRVTSKCRRPTEDQSMRYHLLIMCELLSIISAVRGITCGDWRYQIIPQYVTNRLSIYSSKSSNVLFHSFQSLGPFLSVGGRCHFWFLVSFLHVPLVVHSGDLGEINIGMRACAPNPILMFYVVNHSL